MFVDELLIKCKAGNGGDGVVRWRQEKFVDRGGPAGGDGGRGGDVYMRAVRDISLLGKYTGFKEFVAESGDAGAKRSRHGGNGDDLYIDVPVGATVTELERERVYTFMEEGETHKVLKGGRGGLGNEYFKTSINRSPEQSTPGKKGEMGTFKIELSLIVDVGLIGFPNAGKSTLLNALTNAHVKVGAYPFTTTEPHLGELFGFILADIPGLIEGAGEGKGLGDKFLKHVSRTKMLAHCVSLENEDVVSAYETIRSELKKFDEALLEKDEWILLTKADLVPEGVATQAMQALEKKTGKKVLLLSGETGRGVKEFSDTLTQHLKQSTQKTT